MSIIQRGPKTAGGTSFSSGNILSDEVNADFDIAFNEINGNIDNSNIKESAAISATKIDDVGTSSGVSTPGSASSPSVATTLTGEIERLRYAIGRIALGSSGANVKRYDGDEKNVPWHEQVVRGPNLVRNASFEAQSGGAGTAPDGWALVGTPSTLALGASVVGAGAGQSVRIVTAASVEGISQTFAGLKASTLYLLVVEASVAAGTLSVATTGAMTTGSYRNALRTSTNSARHFLTVLIETDTSPSDLVLYLTGTTPVSDITIDSAGLYEVQTEIVSRAGYLAVSDSSSTTAGLLDTTRRPFPDGDALSVFLSVPGPGYSIRVSVNCSCTDNNDNTMAAILVENEGSPVDVAIGYASIRAAEGGTVALHYVNTNPTAGATYTYSVEARLRQLSGTNNGTLAGVTAISRLTAELIPPG